MELKNRNYFYEAVKKSEYLQFAIKLQLEKNDKRNYYQMREVVELVKKLDNRILQTNILKIYIKYYNYVISEDDRNNLNIKDLRKKIKLWNTK